MANRYLLAVKKFRNDSFILHEDMTLPPPPVQIGLRNGNQSALI